MGVVRRNIVLLRERHVQPAAGEEEEFQHLDVGWQPAGAQGSDIGEIGIAAEQPLDHRSAEARFQQARRLGLFQRERREQGEIDGAVGSGPFIKRIDDVVGLAKAEWQADHQARSDLADDVVDNSLGIGKLL